MYHGVSYVKKNSPGVGITWLKAYFIVSTYDDGRARQSCHSNLRTPCSLCGVGESNFLPAALAEAGLEIAFKVGWLVGCLVANSWRGR